MNNKQILGKNERYEEDIDNMSIKYILLEIDHILPKTLERAKIPSFKENQINKLFIKSVIKIWKLLKIN